MPDLQSLLQLLGQNQSYGPGLSGISAQANTPQTVSGGQPPVQLSGLPQGGGGLSGAPGGGSSLSGTGLTGGPEGMSLQQMMEMFALQGNPGPSTLQSLQAPIGTGGMPGLGQVGGLGQQGLGFGSGGFSQQTGFQGSGDPSNAGYAQAGGGGGVNPLQAVGYGLNAAKLASSLFGGNQQQPNAQPTTSSQIGAQFPPGSWATPPNIPGTDIPYGGPSGQAGIVTGETPADTSIPQAGGGSSLAPVEGGTAAGGATGGGWAGGMNLSSLGTILSLLGGIGGQTGMNPDLMKAIGGAGASVSLGQGAATVASGTTPVGSTLGAVAGAAAPAVSAAGTIGGGLLAADYLTSLISGATGGSGKSALGSIISQWGPTADWQQFPGKVQGLWGDELKGMQGLAQGVLGAQNPQQLQQDVNQYNVGLLNAGLGQDSPTWQGFQYSNPAIPWTPGMSPSDRIPGSAGGGPGMLPQGYAWGNSPSMNGPTPYSIPNLPDWPGGAIHGQQTAPTNIFGPGSQALQQLILARLAGFGQ